MTAVDSSNRPQFQVASVGLEPDLQSLLANSVGRRVQVQAIERLEDLRVTDTQAPTVVVLGPAFADQAALDQAIRLLAAEPGTGAILVTHELTTQLLQRAMRAGISDVVTYDADPRDLEAAIDRAASQLAIRVVQSPPPVASVQEGSLGRVTTVFSPKGGSGKSVVACNLAVSLAQRSAEPVVLIDADLQFGDVAVMLKLAPQHTIVDAVSAMHRLDGPLLRSLLAKGPNGLLVLAAPREPAFGDQVTAGDMHTILDLLRGFAAHVVVDTPTQFSDVGLHLIEASDDLVLVAGMDVPSIKNMKIGLQTLKLLGTPSSKLRLVLNRANAKVGLDVGEVEKTLHLKAEALLPSDIIVPQSVNKGIPAVISAPKSGFARTLVAFSELLVPNVDARRQRG